MNNDDMQELVQDFLVETNEIIENLDHDLVELESNQNDLELLNKKVSEGKLEEVLKNIEDKPLKLPSEYLAEIYEGKFNPKHKDHKKASYWRDIADKQKNMHLLKQ